MTFDRPEALLGLLVLPILWWLLAVRPIQIQWPSLLAWPPGGRAAKRGRRGISALWLMLAAFALLIVALARPVVDASGVRRTIGVVVDRSASLAATTGGGATRWRAVQRVLVEHLRALPEEAFVRVWTTPSWAATPNDALTPDAAAGYIESLEPIPAKDDLESVVERALYARAAGDVAEVWLAGDRLPQLDLHESAPAPSRLTAWTIVADDASNDGIVFAAVVDHGDSIRVDATVCRSGRTDSHRSIELVIGDHVVQTRALGSGDEQGVAFELDRISDGQTIELRLTLSDVLPEDDRFEIVHLPPHRTRVLLDESSSIPLRRALAADSSVEGVPTAPFDLAVCEGVSPPIDSKAWLGFKSPRAAALDLGSVVDVLGLRVASTARVFRGLSLDRVDVRRATEVRGGTPEVIASTAEGSVCIAASNGYSLNLGFAAVDGGWADDPSFPLVVRRVVAHAGGEGRGSGWRWFSTNQQINVSARQLGSAQLSLPEGRVRELVPNDGSFRFRCESRGLVHFTCGEEEWLYAANIASRHETFLSTDGSESDLKSWNGEASPRASRFDLRAVIGTIVLALLGLAWWREIRHRLQGAQSSP